GRYWGSETARVHHAARRRGSSLAARGARAAARKNAPHRHADESGCRRSGSAAPHECLRAGAAAIGLDGRAQRADRCALEVGESERMRKNAAEVVGLTPDVIVAEGSASLAPLLPMTRTIPVVFTIVPDPVGAGFVDSLSQPGGNATGFSQFEYGLSGKWLE